MKACGSAIPAIGHQAIAAGLEQQVLDLAGGTLDVGAEDHLLRRQRLAAALDPGLERAAVLRHQQFQGQVALAQQHAAARSAALALGGRFAGAGRRLPAQLQVGAAAQAEQCQCGHRDNRLLAHSVLPNRSGARRRPAPEISLAEVADVFAEQALHAHPRLCRGV
ncbi:hypothetical protein P4233_15730 [Pseudomonas aeruginosa]|nr:hypothetical protein [Pseudomonas aeruginosa]